MILKAMRLCGVSILFVGVWVIVLPSIGRMASVKQWIGPLRQQGINPSGLYYTDVFETPKKSR
jgi:hypothetical protein